MPNHPIRYLNEAALDGLSLGMGEIVDILESLFREKAKGELLMPPKIFFHRHGPRFYSAMASAARCVEQPQMNESISMPRALVSPRTTRQTGCSPNRPSVTK